MTQHAKTKMFGGKQYRFDSAFSTNTNAKRRAKDLRNLGYLTRVVKTVGAHLEYGVYVYWGK